MVGGEVDEVVAVAPVVAVVDPGSVASAVELVATWPVVDAAPVAETSAATSVPGVSGEQHEDQDEGQHCNQCTNPTRARPSQSFDDSGSGGGPGVPPCRSMT